MAGTGTRLLDPIRLADDEEEEEDVMEWKSNLVCASFMLLKSIDFERWISRMDKLESRFKLSSFPTIYFTISRI